MFAKFISIIIGLLFVSTLTACNSPDKEAPAAVQTPVTYSGTWKMVDSTPDFDMRAEITPDSVVINWIAGDTTSLYWKGSFPATTAIKGDKISSTGDTEAMSSSLLASQDSTKTFTYSDGKLTYQFTMMGVTKTIRLEK